MKALYSKKQELINYGTYHSVRILEEQTRVCGILVKKTGRLVQYDNTSNRFIFLGVPTFRQETVSEL